MLALTWQWGFGKIWLGFCQPRNTKLDFFSHNVKSYSNKQSHCASMTPQYLMATTVATNLYWLVTTCLSASSESRPLKKVFCVKCVWISLDYRASQRAVSVVKHLQPSNTASSCTKITLTQVALNGQKMKTRAEETGPIDWTSYWLGLAAALV